MLLWLSLYYLAPALLCDRVFRLLAKRIADDHKRKWLLVAGLTLSWAPLIMTASERTGPVQFVLAIVHFDANQLLVAPLWQQALLVITVFLIAFYFIFRAKAAPPPTAL